MLNPMAALDPSAYGGLGAIDPTGALGMAMMGGGMPFGGPSASSF